MSAAIVGTEECTAAVLLLDMSILMSIPPRSMASSSPWARASVESAQSAAAQMRVWLNFVMYQAVYGDIKLSKVLRTVAGSLGEGLAEYGGYGEGSLEAFRSGGRTRRSEAGWQIWRLTAERAEEMKRDRMERKGRRVCLRATRQPNGPMDGGEIWEA